MGDFFICPICGNKDPNTIGMRNNKPYCRKCIQFKGKEVINNNKRHHHREVSFHLDYSLSEKQLDISNRLVTNYKNGIDSLVYAVCGSGKTEIVLDIIKYVLSLGLKVCFTVPRRDVIIELFERLSSIFSKEKMGLLYGGHMENLNGDLICCTTHQLYRFNNYFDLLIIDEIDAFPYKDNETLEAFLKKAIKGRKVILTATPSEKLITNITKSGGEVLTLFERYHKSPLPVPQIIIAKIFIKYRLIKIMKNYICNNKPLLIFVPTIDICESIFQFINIFYKKGYYVHSKMENRSQIINDFRNNKYSFLVTTAVLERGVTIKNLQVIIFNSDHKIYDKASLIQIAGRVGRKKDATKGDVIYLAYEKTKAMEESIEEIKKYNKNL